MKQKQQEYQALYPPLIYRKIFSHRDSVSERSKSSIEKRESAHAASKPAKDLPKQECYKSPNEFIERAQKLKLPFGWEIKTIRYQLQKKTTNMLSH